MAHTKIKLFTHYFFVNTAHYGVRQILEQLEYKLQQWDFKPEKGKMTRVKGHKFYWRNAYRTEWRFHIALWEGFLNTIKPMYFFDDVAIENEPLYTPTVIEHTIKPIYQDRDYQAPAIPFLSRLPQTPHELRTIGRNRLLKFRTGRGKSYTLMRAIQELKAISLGLVLAKYIDKWEEDLKRTYVLDDTELIKIQGAGELKKALKNAKLGKNKHIKIYLITLETYRSWLKAYGFYGQELGEFDYACVPDKLYEFLGIGVRFMDEVHLQFHAGYTADLFTHVPLSIGLSATLITRDPFLKQRYQEAYPMSQHYGDDAAVIYANAQAVHFAFKQPEYIRTTERGNNQWSHNAYELSIYSHKPTLYRYLDMLAHIALESFGKVKRQKKKLLILAYRLDMIEMIVIKMQRTFPGLKVRQYIGGSPYEDLTTSDIVVSNYGKAGTAVDVADLTNLLVTINMGADHANIQIIGRLRELKDHDVLMQILMCDNIDKFKSNDKDRRLALGTHVKSYTDIGYGFIL